MFSNAVATGHKRPGGGNFTRGREGADHLVSAHASQ
jgi:hypothetical protein